MASVNPIRYRSYYRDSETGFYYLQSRYYDPVICRFINADAFASTGAGFLGFNMFAYCNNNPENYSDYGGDRLNTNQMVADGGSSHEQGLQTLHMLQNESGIIGVTVSVIGGLGLCLEGSIGFVESLDGEAALIITLGGGGGYGSSFSLGFLTSDKQSVYDLGGLGASAGASVFMAGVDKSLLDDDIIYSIWKPSFGAEVHVLETYTFVIKLW